MAETTGEEQMQEGAELAAALRDRGKQEIEGAKGQLAEGAERVAAAVERTANELEGEGDDAISGLGHSVASLMRQLAGGLRERDVEAFARELADLARRNPGVFLAGSVALGFGIARVFKAQAPPSASMSDDRRQFAGGWHSSSEPMRSEPELDAEDRLDLSATSTSRSDKSQSELSQTSSASRAEQERNAAKSRQPGKSKAKSQRTANLNAEQPPPSSEASTTDSESTGGKS